MNAIIVGGGIVGLNVALSVQARGYDVTLVEPAHPTRTASYGNAGHIATEQVEPLASMAMVLSVPRRLYTNGGALDLPLSGIAHWLPFSLCLLAAAQPERFAAGKSALSALIREAMPAWERRVADIGAPDLLRKDGHFVVWESEASARRGLASWQVTDTGTTTFRPVTDDERAQLQSITRAPIAGAIRFEGTGQSADNPRLLVTLTETFVQRGGKVFTARARTPRQVTGGVELPLETGETLSANVIVVCAGIWSKPLLEPLGLKVPIIAERGYHIQSAQHEWPDRLPPVVFEDRSMIVTGFESGLRVASFVELNSPTAPPDTRKWQSLRRHVRNLGLPFKDEGEEWIGTRPTLPDYLPAIGKVDSVPGLFYAFGHQHLGLTLGPVTGEIVADVVSGNTAPAAFSLNRFR